MKPCKFPSLSNFLGFLFHSKSNTCTSTNHLQFIKDYAIKELNVLLWLALILTTALLLQKVNRLVRLWTIGQSLPGPPCPSFYGHSKLFSSETLSDYLKKSHEKYGSIVRLWLGPTQLLVSVTDPKVIKDMLIMAEDKLPFTERVFRCAFGGCSLFLSSFDEVHNKRDSLAEQLNGKYLHRVNAIHSKVVETVIERMDSIMTKGILDCKSFSQHLAFTILGATLFGDEFLAWSNAIVYEEFLMKIAKDACFWASYSIPPIWKINFLKYRSLCARLKGLTQDIINQKKQNYKIGQADQDSHKETTKLERETATGAAYTLDAAIEDDMFLQNLDGHLNPREESWGNIMGVMFHGCLTTAGLIGNILTMLSMHPEIQNKIYLEIVTVHSRTAKSEINNAQSMTFLLATVYESARLLPAGPLLQRCSWKHDLNLKTGVTVPAGAILVVPLQLVQMEGSSWGSDACQFNPYRFLSNIAVRSDSESRIPHTGSAKEFIGFEEGPVVLKGPNTNAAFLPFGSGTRACVGQQFAILGIATLIAYLLQHYEIILQPGPDDDPKPSMRNSVLQLLPSPKIIFVKRNG